MIDSLMLSAARITTLAAGQILTNASGFFFRREQRLFLVTSRHVVLDEPSGHQPDSLQIELHTDANNLASTVSFSIPLYDGDQHLWRQGMDGAGEIDVAVFGWFFVSVVVSALVLSWLVKRLPENTEEKVEPLSIGSAVLRPFRAMSYLVSLIEVPKKNGTKTDAGEDEGTEDRGSAEERKR